MSKFNKDYHESKTPSSSDPRLVLKINATEYSSNDISPNTGVRTDNINEENFSTQRFYNNDLSPVKNGLESSPLKDFSL